MSEKKKKLKFVYLEKIYALCTAYESGVFSFVGLNFVSVSPGKKSSTKVMKHMIGLTYLIAI